MARLGKSINPNKINFKESFASLRFVPRFFKEIKAVNPLLFYINLLCRIISAVLPVIILWIGKMIIDEVVLQMAADIKDMDRLWLLVGVEFGVAIISDLLSRAISLTDSLLGDQYSIDTSVRFIKKTSELDLDQLEDSEFYDKLE